MTIKHDGIETSVAIKSLGPEPRLLFRELYRSFGYASDLQLKEFDRCCYFLSMLNMPEHERNFYENHNEKLNKYIPYFFGSIQDDKGQWHLLMEDLSDCYCIDQVESPENWGVKEIKLALETLAYFHTIDLSLESPVPKNNVSYSLNEVSSFLENFNLLMRIHSGINRNEIVDNAADKYVSQMEYLENILFEYGKVQIHHDFNIRNMCIDKRTWTLKVYDWEFIDNENPLMDLADFLVSLSPEALEIECLNKWINMYCKMLYSLEKKSEFL